MSEVAKIARPAQMRGFLAATTKKHMLAATVLSIGTTLAYYYGVSVPRRDAYKAFYQNYDPDKAYEQMKKTGVFQSSAAADE